MKIEQIDPLHRASWFTPARCRDYYKIPYQFREIQIHWWDDPANKPSHAGVVEYIKKKTSGSINYVASAGKITRMVAEENCALATQNGNPYGIKIECSPYGTDEDYRTIGWLVYDIQKRRGRLPLVPHKEYWNTSCPGTLDLTRIQKEADKYKEDEMITRGRAIRLLRLARRDTSEAKIQALMQKDEDVWLDEVYRAPWFKEQTDKMNTSTILPAPLRPGVYEVK